MDFLQVFSLGISIKIAVLEEWLLQGQESVHSEATLLPTSWLLFVFKKNMKIISPTV